MKKRTKIGLLIFGIVCVVLMAGSVWYALGYNGGRLVYPANLAEFAPELRDIPMIISLGLSGLFVLTLLFFLFRTIIRNAIRKKTARTTRKLNPKLGWLGLLGCTGFLGFWSFSAANNLMPFAFFVFFGFFGFFYEGKLSNTLMDERFRENQVKAQLTSYKITFVILFVLLLLLGWRPLLGSAAYVLAAVTIVLALTIALNLFLSEYLLYRYDHDDNADEEEE